MIGFMDKPEDVQWLKDTKLKGVPLGSKYQDFKSFVLFGNEDAPTKVHLYVSADPLHTDSYLCVDFDCSAPVYCSAVEVTPKG